mgnify:FL=1
MFFIGKEMIEGFRHLFPHGRFRYVLVVLSLIAAAISVSELIVMKIFTKLVLHEGEFDRTILLLAIAGFVAFFLVTRVGQFYQRNYRVKALEKAFRRSKTETPTKQENRAWSMAFELTNVLSQGTQLVAILLFFLLLNPLVALINIVILIVILQIVGVIFRKQLLVQAELNSATAENKPKPHTRHGARIKAAETGALVSGGGMLALLGVLLYLSIEGDITPANTLVIFLGARLQNSVITGGSRSLMNYARSNLRSVADNDSE